MSKKYILFFVAFLVWLCAVLALGRVFGGNSFDLSAERLYTLDAVSIENAKSINKPINFKLYISENLSSYSREIYNYAAYITAILGQYQKQNPLIKFEIIRVKPYSAEAKIAEETGILNIPFEDEYVYFGLQVFNSEQSTIIPAIIPERRPYFENDINRILVNFINPQKEIVGFLSPETQIFSLEKREKSWTLIDQMAQHYKLLDIPLTSNYIPTNVKVMVLYNPRKLPPRFLYVLDQYVMGGGKLLIFVDPYSEIDHFYKGYPPHSDTNISHLLRRWGIEYDHTKVIGSYSKSLKIADGIQYPLWFFVSGNGMEKLHFRTAGSLEIIPQENVNYEVMLQTPADGGEIKSESLRYSSKKMAIEHYNTKDKTYNLIVKASGEFFSSYTEGYYDNTEQQESIPPFIYVSSPKAAVVVVADSDFVSDDSWALYSDKNNMIYGTAPYADNAEYVLSLIDNLINENQKVCHSKYFDTSNIAAEIV
ncbi:MAG: GldG family protein, partial [Alphaproteobacteria bacterium]|nr:GldG family protein [Alphaproteobacteria bacterium]